MGKSSIAVKRSLWVKMNVHPVKINKNQEGTLGKGGKRKNEGGKERRC